ncbi:MAG: hypothetical protein H0W88_01505 [Parachlamydiaceae bacterium]|nr:hypothetical protein [Parachlamydiaceae bacterium]
MNINYSANANIFSRISNHFVLGVKSEIGGHTNQNKNFIEKTGDFGLWIVEKFPGKVWTVMKDPKVVTLVVTALALVGDSFLFYPSMTMSTVKAALVLLPQIPLWAVRFSSYIFSLQLIISTALRAEGRFMNKELMNRFYNQPAAGTVAAAAK